MIAPAEKLRVRWSHTRQAWKSGRNLFLVSCGKCGGPALQAHNSHRSQCRTCPAQGWLKRERFVSPAHRAVAKAIRHGLLPHPSTLICADCPAQAACYDHRDYTKPLEVQAVCRRCNVLRGPAIQHDHLVRVRAN